MAFANPLRGQTAIGVHILCMSFGAWMAFEAETGKEIEPLLAELRVLGASERRDQPALMAIMAIMPDFDFEQDLTPLVDWLAAFLADGGETEAEAILAAEGRAEVLAALLEALERFVGPSEAEPAAAQDQVRAGWHWPTLHGLWVRQGFSPDSFSEQTAWTFSRAMAGREKVAEDRIAQTWAQAAMIGAAMAGRLGPLSRYLPEGRPHDQGGGQGRGGSAMLGALMAMKERGVKMQVERISVAGKGS